jgi:F-type H+-transporting ATPase subunit c
MDPVAFKYIGVGMMSFGMLGAAIGVSNIFNSLLSSIARNPSAAGQLQKSAFIGAGLAEAMGLFSFVIAVLLLFVV